MNKLTKGFIVILYLTIFIFPRFVFAELRPTLFWSERGPYNITNGAYDHYIRYCIVQTCQPETIATISLNNGLIGDVAVDTVNGKVYWSKREVGQPMIIQRADLDGSGIEDFYTFPNTFYRTDTIEFDAVNRKLILADSGRAKVGSLNVDGTAVLTDIASTSAFPGEVIGLAIDNTNNNFYSLVRNQSGWIVNGSLSGTATTPASLVLRYGDEDNVTGGNYDIFSDADPFSITLDMTGGWIFWSDSTNNSILRTDFNSPSIASTVIFDGSTPAAIPFGVKYDPQEQMLYWSEFTPYKAIYRAPVDENGDLGTLENIVPSASTSGTIYRFELVYLDVGPQDPETETQELIDQIESFLDPVNPILDNSTSTNLISMLNVVLIQIDRGNENSTVALLNNFIQMVNKLIDAGDLTPEEGQPLIDAAEGIIEQILTP